MADEDRAPVSRPSGRRKIATVLREHKRGKLRSSSGKKVASRRQALAIALSEGRKAERGVSFRRRQFEGRRRLRPMLRSKRRRL